MSTSRVAAGTYIQLTRDEFEDWLNTIGFRGKWRLKPGRGGVYQLNLSDTVAIEINSTTGSKDEVMGRGRAAMRLALVSRITGQTLNRKAQGQKHFKRTLNWRETWLKGVERMKAAYMKSKSFYDAIAAIEDRDQYKRDTLALIESVPGWEQNTFLVDQHSKVAGGGILTDNQMAAVQRQVHQGIPNPVVVSGPEEAEEPEPAVDDALVQRMRDLWVAARDVSRDRGADARQQRDASWTMDFVRKWADAVKAGRSLSGPVRRILDEKFQTYGIP